MISLAFKMLIGNRASCMGIIFGIFLATLLISQQSAIFLGLVARSYRLVTDISEPNIWVMDPSTKSEDKLRSLPIAYLDTVRGTPGIEWAVPFSSSAIPVVTSSGTFDVCLLYGIDDATLIGGPLEIVSGSIRDLRMEGAVIIDKFSAERNLATIGKDGKKVPLGLGDTLEINGQRALVVGICTVTQGFYPQPIIFTSISQFQSFVPGMSGRMSYALAKTHPGADIEAVLRSINSHSELNAMTREQFKDQILEFFLETGILINFGLSVALGIIIGFSIAGQMFYLMTIENLTYYALIKAVGGTGRTILRMILFQAALAGIIGYSIGIGATILWGMAIKHTTLAFVFPWQLLLLSGGIVFIICMATAAICIQKVFYADPKMLMGT